MANLRILLADDHELVRQGARTLLEGHPGWEVVGEASTGREALEKATELHPDVVILDISMPDLNGLEATRLILNAVPQTEVLILTMHESEQLVQKVLEAGARAYVSKSDAGRHLVEAVEAVWQHKAYFTSKVATIVLEGYLKGGKRGERSEAVQRPLTSREHEIIQLLAEGKSNKEIASVLGISIHTAETHRSNIMHKLGVHSMSELVRFAVRNNIVNP
jgi:DNA-binding NarL/FixJ family response regulator